MRKSLRLGYTKECMTNNKQSPIDRFWKDKKGRVVIWQTPNVPLIGWFACLLVSRIIGGGTFSSGMSYVSTAFLFTWAYLEIVSGDSYFRRLLGAFILADVIVAHM
jgi:hypothetical protein